MDFRVSFNFWSLVHSENELPIGQEGQGQEQRWRPRTQVQKLVYRSLLLSLWYTDYQHTQPLRSTQPITTQALSTHSPSVYIHLPSTQPLTPYRPIPQEDSHPTAPHHRQPTAVHSKIQSTAPHTSLPVWFSLRGWHWALFLWELFRF